MRREAISVILSWSRKLFINNFWVIVSTVVNTERGKQTRSIHKFHYFLMVGKVSYSLEECRRGAQLPPVSHWSRRWINHWSLWRMASATSDLWLPSQPQGIIALWPVPIYTACWQRRTCVNNLPKVVTRKRNGRESNCDPLSRESNVITITSPGHT